MKFAICNEIFEGWTIERVLEYCAGLGYKGLEIAPFTLAPTVSAIPFQTRREIRQAAARVGMEICGLHWLLAKTEAMSINHPEPAIRQRTGEYLCDLVDFCADLGGQTLVLGSPQQRRVLPGVLPAEAWEFAAQTVAPAVRQAEKRGVVICFEPLAPVETNFINTAAEAVRFAGQFGSPAMKIVLDVKAMSSESAPTPEIIRASWPHFAHVHANDKNFKGPGFGGIDFHPIAAALREVGYEGFISVEVFNFDEGPEAIASGSLEYLQRVFRTQ